MSSDNGSSSSSSNDFVRIAPAREKRTTLSTEDYLKQISAEICDETLNKRNFDSASLGHLAPDVVALHETYPVANGRDELIKNLKSTVLSMPDYRAEILSVTAVVDERKGSATVCLHLFLTGMPDGMNRESVNMLDWRRRKGEWLLIRHAGMRGPPPDSFPGV